MKGKNIICFPEEIIKSIEAMLERLKDVIEENIKPHEIDGTMNVQRDVTFRLRGEMVKFFAGIVDISPNPNFGKPPCEIQKPLLLVYFKEETFIFMIKTSLHRDNIPDLLTGMAKETEILTGYGYLIEGMRIK